MGLYLSIVTGFFVLLLITLWVATHFLRKALNSEDASKIDPLPTQASSKETVA